jgi:amino acid transporter
MRARAVDVALGLYLAACGLCSVWPGLALFAGRERPFVLGLPFSLAWSVAWILATFVALALYHVARSRRSRT